jgi:hypothetical protein
MNIQENTNDFIEYHFGRYLDGLINEDEYLDLMKNNLRIKM